MENATTSLADASGPTPIFNGAMDQQDVEMKEEAHTEPSMPSIIPAATLDSELAPSAQPLCRPLTPARGTATPAPPTQPNPHGSPTRVYLNQNVTPHLLEGIKYLAVYEPDKPLKWLAEFLEKRSKEVEGG
ncbi:hypothetical protein EJ08DRAFT_728896 [Tothia fuscella]|uniref:Uncharacterized protein n=1 Tax=Tothia fuscella TaxID=1048955 RepID=A0A9P4P2U0_9PEZI|nr:hypothetical protein EJ08DRAFT_728896 [Tothia fuscella]